MGEENRIENLDQEVYRSLGKLFKGPVPDTVWSWSLSEFETPEGFLKLVMVG